MANNFGEICSCICFWNLASNLQETYLNVLNIFIKWRCLLVPMCLVISGLHNGLLAASIWYYHYLNNWSQKGLERLCSEISPAAPWLPILVIHIRSQVKKDKVKVTNLKKIKILIFEFCKTLYTWHTFWSCLITCTNMKWIHPEL